MEKSVKKQIKKDIKQIAINNGIAAALPFVGSVTRLTIKALTGKKGGLVAVGRLMGQHEILSVIKQPELTAFVGSALDYITEYH